MIGWINEDIDVIAMRIKLLLKYQKIIERVEKRTRKPRRNYEIKKILQIYTRTATYFVLETLYDVVKGYHTQYQALSCSFLEVLREAYLLELVKDGLIRDMVEDIESYHSYPYEELQVRIYKKIPEYCGVMIETIKSCVAFLREREEWLKEQKKEEIEEYKKKEETEYYK